MDHFVYIASAGAKQTQIAQAVNSHNLANASTAGFRQDLIEAESVFLVGAGEATRAYNVITDAPPDFRTGSLQQTGRDLDIAIQGEGWFAVQNDDGTEGLTRRGDLRVDEFGQLINGQGQALVGNAGPIALPPFSSLAIGNDGTISIVPLGQQPNTVAILDRVKMVNPPLEDIRKNEYGVVQAADGLPSEADGNVRLTTGALESSNVNTVSNLVRMIELSRQFEQYMKLVKVGEELDTSSASLMRLQQ